jgi:hypothetical protein
MASDPLSILEKEGRIKVRVVAIAYSNAQEKVRDKLGYIPSMLK